MRRLLLFLFGMAFAANAVAGTQPVKAFDELTGKDWPSLSEAERQRFIFTGIGGLERQGVFVLRSPREYLEAMDKVLQEPEMREEYLENLFVFCVYDGEPQSREAIDRIRSESVQPEGA